MLKNWKLRRKETRHAGTAMEENNGGSSRAIGFMILNCTTWSYGVRILFLPFSVYLESMLQPFAFFIYNYSSLLAPFLLLSVRNIFSFTYSNVPPRMNEMEYSFLVSFFRSPTLSRDVGVRPGGEMGWLRDVILSKFPPPFCRFHAGLSLNTL